MLSTLLLLKIELIFAAVGILILQYRPRKQSNAKAKKQSAKSSFRLFPKGDRERKINFRRLDLGMLLTEVSTRLRSGAMLESAWEKTLTHHHLLFADQLLAPTSLAAAQLADSAAGHCRRKIPILDSDGVPQVLRKLWHSSLWRRFWLKIPSHTLAALPATFAVCRLGYCAGAPLAQVLDACARGVSEASEAQAARKTALAGPISSARMLAALPVLGILFGFVLGINVLDFLFHSPFGNICLFLGIIFEIAGILYVRFLISQALRDEH